MEYSSQGYLEYQVVPPNERCLSPNLVKGYACSLGCDGLSVPRSAGGWSKLDWDEDFAAEKEEGVEGSGADVDDADADDVHPDVYRMTNLSINATLQRTETIRFGSDYLENILTIIVKFKLSKH